jgi:hypothetical protein
VLNPKLFEEENLYEFNKKKKHRKNGLSFIESSLDLSQNFKSNEISM